MPHFSAPAALELLQQTGLDLPFILVTGSIGEESAVGVMKAGAHDYLLKDKLARLSAVVSREIREAEGRRQRRLAEEALRKSHALLRAVTEGTTDAVFVKDREGRYLMINSAGARFLGKAVKDVIGHDDTELFPPETARRIAEEDRKTMEAGETRTYEEVTTIVGGRHIFLSTKGPYRDQRGNIIGLIGISHDITERKGAEEAQSFLAEAAIRMAESLDYEGTLAKVASLAVPKIADWCLVDLVEEGRPIRQVAAAHADPEKESMARELGRRLPAQNDLEHGVSHVIRAGESEVFPELDDVSRLVPLGIEHPEILRQLGACAYICAPLTARGRAIGAFTFASAERRFDSLDLALAKELARRAALAIDNARLYRQANEAVRARDEFLSVASHELRTPLSALILQLQGLDRAFQKGEVQSVSTRVRGKLAQAVKQTDRLGKLIEGLLDVSRITTGRLKLDYEDFDLVEAIRDVTERFSEEATRARCQLVLRAASSVPGRWDRVRVEQVVTNLLANAIKYAPGKPIEVTVDSDEDVARLSVRDYGIGIAAEDVARIFGRFERAVPIRHYGGLGLGLYISRQIVEASGGTIRVASEPGRGSTFTVELPRRPRTSTGAGNPAKRCDTG